MMGVVDLHDSRIGRKWRINLADGCAVGVPKVTGRAVCNSTKQNQRDQRYLRLKPRSRYLKVLGAKGEEVGSLLPIDKTAPPPSSSKYHPPTSNQQTNAHQTHRQGITSGTETDEEKRADDACNLVQPPPLPLPLTYQNEEKGAFPIRRPVRPFPGYYSIAEAKTPPTLHQHGDESSYAMFT
ncbi:hypothetical protein LZ31DRAFT_39894 [Colletotrichum somersetense]|nr:hypothetical protein LZ31DRAFT_39894 [Colletotrichum somersetense]